MVFTTVLYSEAEEKQNIFQRNYAEHSGITNTEFYLGNAEDVLPELTKIYSPDTVILDPPRKGCDKTLIDTLNKVKPHHIVYVSCDPSTLARDIKALEGYKVEQVVPFDMFPHTKHVESVAMLTLTN